MDTNRSHTDTEEHGPAAAPEAVGEGTAINAPAWEQVAHGRYMPRRIRGSCPGRELG